MRVILDLNQDILDKLQEKAEDHKRSRKAHMEFVLESEANDNNPVLERQQGSKSTEHTFPSPPERKSDYDAYNEEINSVKDVADLPKIVRAIETDLGLSSRQKENLKTLAAQKQEQIGFN